MLEARTPEPRTAATIGTPDAGGRATPKPESTANHDRYADPAGQQPPEAALTTDLQRAATAMRQHIERVVLHDAGLNWTTFEVLRLVASQRKITLGGVATNTGLSKAAVTNTSRALVRRRLIHRVLDPDDHRRVYLRPTVDGWRTAVDLGRHISQEERRILTHGAPGLPSRLLHILRDLDGREHRLGG